MYRIRLVNMPFSNLSFPSIALSQLRSVIRQRFGDRVDVRILYLNQEFAQYFGFEFYQTVTGTLQANSSGLGDWIFRQIAFPELPDNSQLYFQRYFPHLDERGEALKGLALAKRQGLARFMDRLISLHQLDSADLVGFTSMFAQNGASFAMARRIKARNSEVTTVMGGANCEAPMGRELARHIDAVDYFFSGPGLVSFPQFIACMLAGEVEETRRIRGVFCRENVDSELLAGRGAIGAELPITVPVPLDYDDFLDGLAKRFPRGQVGPRLTFETSRGCWWGERSHCTFCGLNGSTMGYRSMTAEQALELFEDLFRRYGDRCKDYESVDNIMPREYLKEVFPHLEPPPGTTIFYEVKADLKPREMEVLSRGGVTHIQPGIESLATSTLKLMGKGTTAFQNLAFLKHCLRYGISPVWNLLIGFPGEGQEVYRKYLADIPSLVHLPPPAGAHPVRFDRYSPYFIRSEEYGLDLAPYEFYRAIYPIDEEGLHSIAYFFEDRNYDAQYMQEMIHWKGELAGAIEAWMERRRGSDRRPPAELVVSERSNGTRIVRDTRSGDLVEHRVRGVAAEVLDLLHEKPSGPGRIADRLGAGREEVAEAIIHLDGLDLLFEEEGRYLSLVLEPA